MAANKNEHEPKKPKSAPKNLKDQPTERKQSGDPDNPSDTTGATEAGEEDVGAKS